MRHHALGRDSNHSLSAAFMRVCHPAPVSLKASMTSASNRMVVDRFVRNDFGLPITPVAITSTGNGAASSSPMAASVMRASSSGVFKRILRPDLVLMYTVIPHFSVIGFTQTDDSSIAITINEGREVKPVSKRNQGALPVFPIVPSGISPDERVTPRQRVSRLQFDPMLLSIDGVFGGVKTDLHATYCSNTSAILEQGRNQ